MMNSPQQPQPASTPPAKTARKDAAKSAELLREQSKTETEERPYLDTEGGE